MSDFHQSQTMSCQSRTLLARNLFFPFRFTRNSYKVISSSGVLHFAIGALVQEMKNK